MVIEPMLRGEAAKFMIFDRYRDELQREIVLLFHRLKLADAAAQWMEEYDIPEESLMGGGLVIMEKSEPGWRVSMEFDSLSLGEKYQRDRHSPDHHEPTMNKEAKNARISLFGSIERLRINGGEAS